MSNLSHRLCIAPMMDWTDRHCRVFFRLLTRRARLYSEMIPTGAILHGDRARFLGFDPVERPLALQLGGADADELARAAVLGQAWGYDEINLNCGCPSDRVQQARFGACLMSESETVRQAVAAMRHAVDLPVTVKCRIGVDEQDDYEHLLRFVDSVAEGGCETFVVHARKAWLKGLSPKENREIPPLRYEVVQRLKAERPALAIVLNGGFTDLASAKTALAWADGVMLGRAAYQNPWLLAAVDREIYGEPGPAATRAEVVEGLAAYAERLAAEGQPLRHLARHVLGLMNGLPGARLWRRRLSEGMQRSDAAPALLREAAAQLLASPPSEAAA